MINTGEIVGVFDLETASLSKETKLYLAAAQKNGQIREVSPELPKAFVVCERDEAHTVFLSQISPGTLEKRSHYLKDLI